MWHQSWGYLFFIVCFFLHSWIKLFTLQSLQLILEGHTASVARQQHVSRLSDVHTTLPLLPALPFRKSVLKDTGSKSGPLWCRKGNQHLVWQRTFLSLYQFSQFKITQTLQDVVMLKLLLLLLLLWAAPFTCQLPSCPLTMSIILLCALPPGLLPPLSASASFHTYFHRPSSQETIMGKLIIMVSKAK